MTDAELNRLIAEHLEPVPSPQLEYPAWSEYWRRSYSLDDLRNITACGEWEPANFCRDPALWSMLLEKIFMKLEYKQVLLDREPVLTDNPICILRHAHIYMHGVAIGRAVAECFAKSEGLI